MNNGLETIKVKLDLVAFERLLEERHSADAVTSTIRRRLGMDVDVANRMPDGFRSCTICQAYEHDSWGNRTGKVHVSQAVSMFRPFTITADDAHTLTIAPTNAKNVDRRAP